MILVALVAVTLGDVLAGALTDPEAWVVNVVFPLAVVVLGGLMALAARTLVSVRDEFRGMRRDIDELRKGLAAVRAEVRRRGER